MSSSSRCRRSAQLSRIAQLVYGSVPARPMPAQPFVSPLVNPLAASRRLSFPLRNPDALPYTPRPRDSSAPIPPFPGGDKGGKRRGN